MAVFTETFSRLRQNLDQSHQDRQKLIQDIRDEVQDLARKTGNQIQEQASQRQEEFTQMMGNLRGTIRSQAEQTRGQLADLAADLRQGGAVFAGRQWSGNHGSRRRSK